MTMKKGSGRHFQALQIASRVGRPCSHACGGCVLCEKFVDVANKIMKALPLSSTWKTNFLVSMFQIFVSNFRWSRPDFMTSVICFMSKTFQRFRDWNGSNSFALTYFIFQSHESVLMLEDAPESTTSAREPSTILVKPCAVCLWDSILSSNLPGFADGLSRIPDRVPESVKQY